MSCATCHLSFGKTDFFWRTSDVMRFGKFFVEKPTTITAQYIKSSYFLIWIFIPRSATGTMFQRAKQATRTYFTLGCSFLENQCERAIPCKSKRDGRFLMLVRRFCDPKVKNLAGGISLDFFTLKCCGKEKWMDLKTESSWLASGPLQNFCVPPRSLALCI